MKRYTPTTGDYFSQAREDIEIYQRVVVQAVYLSDESELVNWKEITQAEADEINKAIEDYFMNLESQV